MPAQECSEVPIRKTVSLRDETWSEKEAKISKGIKFDEELSYSLSDVEASQTFAGRLL